MQSIHTYNLFSLDYVNFIQSLDIIMMLIYDVTRIPGRYARTQGARFACWHIMHSKADFASCNIHDASASPFSLFPPFPPFSTFPTFNLFKRNAALYI